jgi:hypothetical protein
MPSLRIALRQRLGGYRRSEAARIVTKDPWTKDFKHLQNIPRHWMKPVNGSKAIRTVHSKDRIKYWNIVPGDKIRVRGDRSGIIHEVLAINKLRNRVHLKDTATVCTISTYSRLKHQFSFPYRQNQPAKENRSLDRKMSCMPTASYSSGTTTFYPKMLPTNLATFRTFFPYITLAS